MLKKMPTQFQITRGFRTAMIEILDNAHQSVRTVFKMSAQRTVREVLSELEIETEAQLCDLLNISRPK